MAIYSIGDLCRREILKMSAVLAGSGVVLSTKLAGAEAALQRTPGQVLGPFYPLGELPQSSDLTRVPGRSGRAEGQVLNVMGRVLNLSGEPVRNARVEIWQANAYGRYSHPSDSNLATLDPNFEGAALADDRLGRPVSLQDNQASSLSCRTQQVPACPHPLPSERPTRQACNADVF